MSHTGAAPGDDNNARPATAAAAAAAAAQQEQTGTCTALALGSFHSSVSRSRRLWSTSPASCRCSVRAASAVKRGEQSAHLTRLSVAVASSVSSVAEKPRAAAKCDPPPSPCQRVQVEVRLISLLHRSAVVRWHLHERSRLIATSS